MTQLIGNFCYYNDENICTVDLWQCQTCLNFYCSEHFHDTDQGSNVECVACERERLEYEETIHTYKVILAWDVEAMSPTKAALAFWRKFAVNTIYYSELEVRQFVDTDKPDLVFQVCPADPTD